MSIFNENLLQNPVLIKQRIQHFKLRAEWDLICFIENFLQIDNRRIHELLKLGSIYCNGRRLFQNTKLQIDDYLRVHTEPRRFSIINPFSDIIIFEDDYFLAVNKPAGIPCHPTLDNSLENILSQLRLDRNQDYYLCHRLDIGTQGILLFAKSAEIQTHMMQNWHDVRKFYRAQTQGPKLEPQLLKHWMRPHPRAPKIIASRPVENWHACELQILESKIIENKTSSQFNEYDIELLTGRTHQIRAQLGFEQNPILGDEMYGSQFIFCLNPYESNRDQFALKCTEISFHFLDKKYQLKIH